MCKGGVPDIGFSWDAVPTYGLVSKYFGVLRAEVRGLFLRTFNKGMGILCKVMPQVFQGSGFGFGAKHLREVRWCIEF